MALADRIVDRDLSLAMFYLWIDENATYFCPVCVTDALMGEDCPCGEEAWISLQAPGHTLFDALEEAS